MCDILFCDSKNEIGDKMARVAACLIRQKNTDGLGVMWRRDGSDWGGVHAVESLPYDQIKGGHSLLMHGRTATAGAVSPVNVQPFRAGGRILAHNGHFYKLAGLDGHLAVNKTALYSDSHLFFKGWISSGLPFFGYLKKNKKNGLYNIVAIDRSVVYIATNMGIGLDVYPLPGGGILASTMSTLTALFLHLAFKKIIKNCPALHLNNELLTYSLASKRIISRRRLGMPYVGGSAWYFGEV